MATIIDKNKCINCGICYDRCPEESFGINDNGEIYVQYPEECWLCGACEMDCPAGAIQVRYEINASPMFVSLSTANNIVHASGGQTSPDREQER